MAYVIHQGNKKEKSEEYSKFVRTCCEAYQVLRKHASVLINMFMLMVSSGMPELQTFDDINYLKSRLNLDCTDEEADSRMRAQLESSLANVRTLINFAIHNAAHS